MKQKALLIGIALALLLVLPTMAQIGSETIMVPMPDGAELATELYLPEDEAGSFPVLLLRTPYGRLGAGEISDLLTENGVAVVTQDTRGRFDSPGDYAAFRDDRVDGQATLDWIVEQPWSNGRIATFGGSALGIAQYMLAPGANDALNCQWVDVGTPNMYRTVYENGVYRSALIDLWLEDLDATGIIPELRANPTASDWWDVADITQDFAEVNVTAFHIGGYYDIFARGTIAAFLGYQNESQAAGQQHLIMGPWTHGVNSTQIGEIAIPEAEADFYEDWLFMWLDACLLDGAIGIADMNDLAELPAVSYFTMGAVGEEDAPGNEWRTAETWPPADSVPTPMYLQPNNALSLNPPPADSDGDTFVYDPTDPTPTICGANLILEAGACDQRPVEARDDVVIYSTPVLEEPVEVTGNLQAEIWISTDVVDTDIAVRVTDVYPDGTSLLVLDSIMRARYHNSPDFTTETLLTPGEPVLLSFDLGPTSYIFNAGHQIRVSITSSNAPRFAPNPNTGAMFLDDGESGQIATTTILHDADHPSAIILPLQ